MLTTLAHKGNCKCAQSVPGAGLTNPRVDGRVRASLYRQPEPVPHAEVAKLVDALASGASWGNPVEVQVLSSAPNRKTITDHQTPRNTLYL
jgi:hypothetical protein